MGVERLTKRPSQLAEMKALVVASASPMPCLWMVTVGCPTLTVSNATLPATMPEPYSIRKSDASVPCTAVSRPYRL